MAVLPVHYRDDDLILKYKGGLCEYSGIGDMDHGCPRGCSGAREHYANDGHEECEED